MDCASKALPEKGWHPGFASTSLPVMVKVKLPLIPLYAPVPEPATTGAAPVTAACPEHVFRL
jgi:hypothetical protein